MCLALDFSDPEWMVTAVGCGLNIGFDGWVAWISLWWKHALQFDSEFLAFSSLVRFFQASIENVATHSALSVGIFHFYEKN